MFVAVVIVVTWILLTVPLQPDIHHLNAKYPIWENVGPGMFAFSAYLDVREHNFYSERGAVALVVQTNQVEQTIYCLLTDNMGQKMCVKKPVKKVMMHKTHHKYQQYFYICDIPSSATTPKFVSFSFNTSCLDPSSQIPVIQVHNETNSSKEFGVCIESPLFHMNDVQFIIQVIEMNRILGAEWFTFYVNDASKDVRSVLEDYSKEGLVEVVTSTIPNISVHYYGQQVLMHDCGYRNMYKVKYLVYTDLDELIVPQKHQNWSQMIAQIDNKSIGGFQFRHVARSGKSAIKKLRICNSSKEIEIPRFMEFTEQSKPFPIGKKAKFLIKSQAILRMEVHAPGKLMNGYFTYCVQPEIGLLYHYRLPLRYTKNNVKDADYNLTRYFSQLIASIEMRVC